ncbi:uncharacterized protein LOC129746706 isoform X1 [Uranotaenia lowii]|uniref:uncharacterized protein LOC129746706 isoform X1 n=1 Tax=Uranotaenia lowii TaxID=190385 RepID=UPI00247853BE|nr:uncharacterized protein LOC129746706 isoform X1 [Uranotaenia lowii]
MGGIPVLSLPIRLSKRGLSISLELMGPSFSEQQLFQSVRWIEKEVDDFLEKRIIIHSNFTMCFIRVFVFYGPAVRDFGTRTKLSDCRFVGSGKFFPQCRRMRSSSSTFLDFGYWTTSEDIVTKAANRRAGALFAERNFSTSAVPLNAGFQTLSVMQPLCRIRGWCYHHELKLMKNN